MLYYVDSSSSSSCTLDFLSCGSSIANTNMFTMMNMAIAEMKTSRRLRLYASMTRKEISINAIREQRLGIELEGRGNARPAVSKTDLDFCA